MKKEDEHVGKTYRIEINQRNAMREKINSASPSKERRVKIK